MTTFAFILFVLNASGDYSTFVLDHDLSDSDCAALEAEWTGTLDQFSHVACRPEMES